MFVEEIPGSNPIDGMQQDFPSVTNVLLEDAKCGSKSKYIRSCPDRD